MVTFRNNNNNRRNNFRRNDRNYKINNGDRSKFGSSFTNNDNFQRKAPGRNNHNASKLIEKYNNLAREALSIGDKINLELPLKFGQKISGHLCQGHVDCTSKVNKIIKKGKSRIYDFTIDKNNLSYLIPKASILLNGVSLTISKVTKKGFQVWLIPHSLKLTNLSDLKKGQIVNVEIDILSKYIKKHYGKK